MPKSRLQRRQVNPITSGFVAKETAIHPTTIQFLFSFRARLPAPGQLFTEPVLPRLLKSISKTAWVVGCQAGDGKTMGGVEWVRNCISKPLVLRFCAFKPARTVCRLIKSSSRLGLI